VPSSVGIHQDHNAVSHTYTDDDVDHIYRGLLNRSLPQAEWTHAAHFAAALWLLRQARHDAMQQMPRLIRAYNEATGVANTDSGGYHETITIASLRAAHAWLHSRPHASVCGVLNALLATEYGRPDWLLTYWTRTTLFSVQARRNWVEPDLKPLPF
jgi:hypothetical protein